jgi:hypothetical protein
VTTFVTGLGCPSGLGLPEWALGAQVGLWVPKWAFGSFEMFARLFIYFSFNFQFCIGGGIWGILVLKPGGWVPLFWVLGAIELVPQFQRHEAFWFFETP